jgi:DHA1 family bicyclomycin/chloramphenicol resistance-like MFS transporter
MAVMVLINLAYNALVPASLPWALIPIGLYALGWALVQPSISLMVMDLFPARRGMAASLQGSLASAGNAIVAGVITPIAMVSPLGLAIASAVLMLIGLAGWLVFRKLI